MVSCIGHTHQLLIRPAVEVCVLSTDDAVACIARFALTAVHGVTVVTQVVAVGILVAIMCPICAGVSRLAHLFVGHGMFDTSAKGLWACESWWAGQAVVTRVCVLTQMFSVVIEAGIRHFFALIDVFALDAVSTIARWACATFPAAIRIASTLGTSKAGVGQAPINWTVLLIANLIFGHITNTVFASELRCGVVTKSTASLYSSSTGDRADVPW